MAASRRANYEEAKRELEKELEGASEQEKARAMEALERAYERQEKVIKKAAGPRSESLAMARAVRAERRSNREYAATRRAFDRERKDVARKYPGSQRQRALDDIDRRETKVDRRQYAQHRFDTQRQSALRAAEKERALTREERRDLNELNATERQREREKKEFRDRMDSRLPQRRRDRAERDQRKADLKSKMKNAITGDQIKQAKEDLKKLAAEEKKDITTRKQEIEDVPPEDRSNEENEELTDLNDRIEELKKLLEEICPKECDPPCEAPSTCYCEPIEIDGGGDGNGNGNGAGGEGGGAPVTADSGGGGGGPIVVPEGGAQGGGQPGHRDGGDRGGGGGGGEGRSGYGGKTEEPPIPPRTHPDTVGPPPKPKDYGKKKDDVEIPKIPVVPIPCKEGWFRWDSIPENIRQQGRFPITRDPKNGRAWVHTGGNTFELDSQTAKEINEHYDDPKNQGKLFDAQGHHELYCVEANDANNDLPEWVQELIAAIVAIRDDLIPESVRQILLKYAEDLAKAAEEILIFFGGAAVEILIKLAKGEEITAEDWKNLVIDVVGSAVAGPLGKALGKILTKGGEGAKKLVGALKKSAAKKGEKLTDEMAEEALEKIRRAADSVEPGDVSTAGRRSHTGPPAGKPDDVKAPDATGHSGSGGGGLGRGTQAPDGGPGPGRPPVGAAPEPSSPPRRPDAPERTPDAPEGTSPDAPEGQPRKSGTDQPPPPPPPPEPPGKWPDNLPKNNQALGDFFEKRYAEYARRNGRKIVGTQVPMKVKVKRMKDGIETEEWVEIRADALEIVEGKVHIVDVKASSNAKPIKNASGEVTGYEVDPHFTDNQKDAYPWAQAGSEVQILGDTERGREALRELRQAGIAPDATGGLAIGDVRVEVFSPANLETPIPGSIRARTNRAGNVVPDGSVQVR